ncbi:MAG TPA: preprotein translocase subunit YajC [Acidobacteriaceae bacterium]|nr:preprotein translocase subunit YajC [Acidobacteriaceae bacterium]
MTIGFNTLAFWVLAAGSGGGGILGSLTGLPLLLLMFAAMYFLLIAPNQKKQRQWQSQLAALKPGDRVTTNGGIRGTIVSMKDDSLIIRTQPDGVKLELVKTAIAAVTTDEPVKS